jgi:putative DNA primase/helicase
MKPASMSEKISKIEALRDGASTEGEQVAAEAALKRLQSEHDHQAAKEKDHTKPTGLTPSKAVIRITATVEHIDRGESYYEVTYTDVTGNDRVTRIGREMFYEPRKVVDLLAKAHASLPNDRYAAIDLVKKALEAKGNRQYRVTAKSGFYGDESFVHPVATFGKLSSELLWDGSNNIDPALGQTRGTCEQWRKGMWEPIKYSDYLLLACSISLASSLLHVMREDEGAIFHLHGRNKLNSQLKTSSSSGKSLAARAAASTTGRCRKNDLVTFAASVRSIEDYCFARNHLGAQFDEEGRSLGSGTGPRIKSDELPYLVPSGRGGLRSKKATRDPALENLTWALFAISTGEAPLDDPKTRRHERPEGAQVRMISVPVPPGGEGGIFNRVKGAPGEVASKCKRLARQVEETIASNYGVVTPAYLPELLAAQPAVERRARKIIEAFIERVGADREPWERRFAEKFGIILSAAILLSEWEIGPWTSKRARRAIDRLYKVARSAVVSVEDATTALIQRLRDAVNKQRFPTQSKGLVLSTKRSKRVWGVTEKHADLGRIIFVRLARIKSLVGPPAIVDAVLSKLEQEGILLRYSDGKLTQQKMVKGMTGRARVRYVRMKRSLLRKADGSNAKCGGRLE